MKYLANWRSILARDRNFYIVLLVAMLVRSFPFGFQYFPFSDDFNAYGVYALYSGNLWRDVVIPYVLYGFRPLAGLTDAYLISRFWPNLAVVLLGITLLHFVTIVLLDKVLTRSDIAWGRAAAVFFAFFPALTESAYWISASARIVTSTFFAALAAFAILKFIHKEGRHMLWLAVALLAGLAAQGFYEQGILFAIVLTMGVLILHRKSVRPKALFAWPFANLAIIGVHYFLFRDVSQLGPRAEATDNIFAQIPTVADRIVTTFIREQAPTVANTARWGFEWLVTEHLPLTALMLALCALLALFVMFDGRARLTRAELGRSAIAGAVVIGSTLALFFVLAESWVWVRNFFWTILGLAIFAELAVRAALVFLRGVKRAAWRIIGFSGMLVAAFLAIALFFSGFILEVESIRRVEHYDRQIMHSLIAETERLETDDANHVWLFGVQWIYAPTINPRITSQLRLDWAIDGYYLAITETPSRERPFWIIPVMNGHDADIDMNRDVLLGLDETLAVRELRLEAGDLIFADTGEVFGTIDENGLFMQP